MTTHSLQQLYEDPATPLISGSPRAMAQTQMLIGLTADARRPLRAVDVGCGEGTWTAMAADGGPACRHRHHHHRARLVGLGARAGAGTRPGSHAGLGRASRAAAGVRQCRRHHRQRAHRAPRGHRHRAQRGPARPGSGREPPPLHPQPGGLVQPGPAHGGRAADVHRGEPAGESTGAPDTRWSAICGSSPGGPSRPSWWRHGFVDIVITGAPYHDVPRPLRPLDRLMCRTPSLSSILLASAHAP